MAEHYLLIETKIQKMRPTNQFSPEIIATSFNLHLQKLSVKLISGLCQCQHTYDTHFCHKLPPPLWHETWQLVQLVVFSRGHRKETDWHTEHTDFSSCCSPSWAGAIPARALGTKQPYFRPTEHVSPQKLSNALLSLRSIKGTSV